jgi:hypothetical protein
LQWGQWVFRRSSGCASLAAAGQILLLVSADTPEKLAG